MSKTVRHHAYRRHNMWREMSGAGSGAHIKSRKAERRQAKQELQTKREAYDG